MAGKKQKDAAKYPCRLMGLAVTQGVYDGVKMYMEKRGVLLSRALRDLISIALSDTIGRGTSRHWVGLSDDDFIYDLQEVIDEGARRGFLHRWTELDDGSHSHLVDPDENDSLCNTNTVADLRKQLGRV